MSSLVAGVIAPLGDGVVAAQHADGSADQRIDVGVDARIELFSVLERLAGRPEYGVAATPYARAVDEWFGPYADDPAVVTFRELVSSHGIGYDAAMTLAVQLDENLAPVRPLTPLPEGLDRRWEGVDLASVLDEVAAFASTARFDEFMASQHEYVSDVEDAFRRLVASRPVLDWFDAVFGARGSVGYHVVPGLLTGLMSFGVHAGADEIYAIMSLEAPDEAGIPALGLLTEEYLVHELAHSYVNPVVSEHVERFDGPLAGAGCGRAGDGAAGLRDPRDGRAGVDRSGAHRVVPARDGWRRCGQLRRSRPRSASDSCGPSTWSSPSMLRSRPVTER